MLIGDYSLGRVLILVPTLAMFFAMLPPWGRLRNPAAYVLLLLA